MDHLKIIITDVFIYFAALLQLQYTSVIKQYTSPL